MHKPAIALLSMLLAACGAATPGPNDASSAGGDATASAKSSGPKAPDFTLPTLDGKNVSLSDYTGKNVVLIDFWSTTCDPCLVEMPHLVEMYEKYKAQGFVILAISLDGPESRTDVTTTVHQKKMSFPVLLDEETTVVARYNPKRELPFSVLIDKNGTIVRKMGGYTPGDEAKIAAEVEKLLR